MKIKVTIKGTAKDGYVMSLSNDVDNFLWDIAILKEELLAIRDAINKKIK